MTSFESAPIIGATFSPVHFVILAIAVVAILALVIFAVRKLVRWVKHRRDTKVFEVI